ncbi:MAG: SoxR reducing system RseC family protein [Clostridia bacterium]|nr:SoxR reducing system RseC family protein [Clostridia bacterium]
MKQKARVVSVDKDRATVEVQRKTMCDGCHKSECGDGCSLYKIFGGDSSFRAEALNSAGANTGDLVYVEATDASVNLSAFFVFLLPVILAVCAYLVTSFISEEGIRLAVCGAVFALYFVVLAVVEKARKKRAPKMRVTEVIDDSAEIV